MYHIGEEIINESGKLEIKLIEVSSEEFEGIRVNIKNKP